MSPLEHVPFGRRVLLTAIIILVVLLFMWVFELLSAQEKAMAQSSEGIIVCADEDVRDALRQISYDSLDLALKDRINHLFSVWMRDDTQQPARFLVGARMAIRGYIQGRHIVSTWDPKPCPR